MHWWQIKKLDADLERELQADLELEEEQQRKLGLSSNDARTAARRALGNTTLIREQAHESWGWASVERLILDLRYALRQLNRSRGFTIVAVMTLALGIGSTTSIFTLIYDVMLRPLPFPQSNRLVTIEEKLDEWSNLYPVLPVNANHFTFWKHYSRSFDDIAVMTQGSVPMGSSGRPLQIGVLAATPGLFNVLGVQPQLGRGFSTAEAQKGNDRFAVLLYDLWREQFAGDPSILGKTIRLNGFPYTVIGVMPPSFHVPAVQTLASVGETHRPLSVGVIEPLSFSKERLAEGMGDFNYFGLARMKAGVTIAAAAADLNALQQQISAKLPADEKGNLSVHLESFQRQLIGKNQKPLMLLLAAVGGLLLVGCVNVTNLQLARAVGQRQQMAVAAALGARRAELVRMALRETAVLSIAGGGIGVMFAATAVPAMSRFLPPALDFNGALHLDWAGAGFAVALATLAALLAGAAPALMVSRTAPNEVLRSESRLASEPRANRRARRVLVGVEAGVSIALILFTALLASSLTRLMRVNRGFSAEQTTTAVVDLPMESYPDTQHRSRFYHEALDRIVHLPGVMYAAVTSVLPLTGDSWGDMARIAGDNRPYTQLPVERFRSVSPEYFQAIHLPLIAGAFFSQSDWGKNVAVITQTTAKTLWPGKNPIGQQFKRGDPDEEKPFTVVGVVADARTISLAKPDPMMVYVPYWYRCEPVAGIVVRTHQDPSEMAEALRRAIWSVDRSVPVPTVRTLNGVMSDSVANERFLMELLLLFAASALFLAGLGVYGVVMYSVAQRYREIGLRIALGAQRAAVYTWVLRDGLAPVAIGASAGLFVGLWSARLIRTLLFQVNPYDPALAAGAFIALIVVGAAACLVPARRAANVEPMRALRTQ